ADDQHARAPEALGDHAAEDLQRRERVLDPRETEAVELVADVAAARPRVVGEEGHAAARAMQRGERLPGPGVQRVALPDAAVEVEDEAPAVGEQRRLSRRKSA